MKKEINIGVICYQFGNLQRGGAEVQVDFTIMFLNRIEGINVEIINYESNDLNKYDIIHFFKSPPEFGDFARILKIVNVPYVVSTIMFTNRFYWLHILKYRIITCFPSKIRNLFLVSNQLFLWKNAKYLFPNTDEEALLMKRLGCNPSSIKIVENGLCLEDMDIANAELFISKFPNLKNVSFVLNVARIDRRKNQKKLVEACRNLNIAVVVIGKIWEQDYFEEIIALNYDKFYYLGPIYDKSMLFGAYKMCRVFALPSFMETPGIAALEAAYYNKPIVITKYGGTKFYFKENASYVDWRSVDEITLAIKNSLEIEDPKTHELVLSYSWKKIVEKYVDVYRTILKI